MTTLDSVLEAITKGFETLAKDGEPAKTPRTVSAEEFDQLKATVDRLVDALEGDGEDTVSKSLSDIREAFDAHQTLLEMLIEPESGERTPARKSAAADDDDDDGDAGRKTAVKKSRGGVFDDALRGLASGSGRSLTLG